MWTAASTQAALTSDGVQNVQRHIGAPHLKDCHCLQAQCRQSTVAHLDADKSIRLGRHIGVTQSKAGTRLVVRDAVCVGCTPDKALSAAEQRFKQAAPSSMLLASAALIDTSALALSGQLAG